MKSLNNQHRKYSISNLGNSEADRVEFMVNNMKSNKAYIYESNNLDNSEDKKNFLIIYKKRFLNYREDGGQYQQML